MWWRIGQQEQRRMLMTLCLGPRGWANRLNFTSNVWHTRWSFLVSSRYVFEFHIPEDVIKWKHLLRYWPFVRGIHRSSVNSPPKGQWRAALMFSLICACTNGLANHRDTGDLRRHIPHYDVAVMSLLPHWPPMTPIGVMWLGLHWFMYMAS